MSVTRYRVGMRWVSLVVTLVTACGGGSGGPPVGDDCEVDSDCVSNVCWDFSDYDPFCQGKVCSASCTIDDDCIEMATNAGAASPEEAQCGADQLCDFVGTGLGLFACA